MFIRIKGNHILRLSHQISKEVVKIKTYHYTMKSENSHAKIAYLESGSLNLFLNRNLTESLKNYYNFENKKRIHLLIQWKRRVAFSPRTLSMD